MRTTTHPRRRGRQERALSRRVDNLTEYEASNFKNAKNPEKAIERVRVDIKNLSERLPKY